MTRLHLLHLFILLRLCQWWFQKYAMISNKIMIILFSIKVFVFTPHIFLNYLCHGYFSMENIAVIIFDECHHVFGKSVYNEIMSIFYHQHYPVSFFVVKTVTF
jgi:superfamily II DNA/RNA helicase